MEDKVIGRRIKSVNNLIKRSLMRIDTIKESNKLTSMHGYLLGYLYVNRDHDVYQRDIERAFDIRRSTVTEILQLMENNGLIERRSVPQDKRLKRLVLTEEAERLHKQVAATLDRFDELLRADIAQDDLDCFFRVLDQIENNLRQSVSLSE